MVVVGLHSIPYEIKYKARLCSKATLFVAIANLICFVFPLIFIFRSRGFWYRHDTFLEQPDVRFMGEYLFVGYINNFSSPIICSNLPGYQLKNMLNLCPHVKIREIDNNFDGKPDELVFKLKANIPKGTDILMVNLILTIDYKLRRCPFKMQSAIILQEPVNTLLHSLNVMSVLQIMQLHRLTCYFKHPNICYTRGILQDELEIDHYKFQDMITEYMKRNMSTYITYIHKHLEIGEKSTFKMQLQVVYPEHQIFYEPGFWQIVLRILVQYWAVYAIFSWSIKKIKNYVFQNNIFLFLKVNPLKKQT